MYKKQIISMIVFLYLFSNWALAKELGVTILKIRGECEVMRAGEVEWSKAKVNMRLYINDRIRTKFISNATIEFDDGTIIEMKENTTIDIKELFEDKWTGRTKSEMKMWIGKILGSVKKLKTKDSEFNIHTPVAVIGIRGTKFEVEVDEKGQTICRVHKGVVRMRGGKEPEDKWTTIKENEYATCISEDKVTPPEIFKPVPPEEIPHLSEVLKERKALRGKVLKEKILLHEEELPKEELPEQPILPSSKINVQFPEQNKPFINRIPNVTVFISPPPVADIKEIPTCFLQIENDKPIELPKGVDKYRFRPFLKPGTNKLVIKAWWEKGQISTVVVNFPFFDPYPPVIRAKKYLAFPLKLVERIKEQHNTTNAFNVPVEILITVADLGSGIKDVLLNGRLMEKIKEDYYKGVISLKIGLYVIKLSTQQYDRYYYNVERLKLLEEVKLKVTDKAGNEITEILSPREIEDEIKEKLRRRLNRKEVSYYENK